MFSYLPRRRKYILITFDDFFSNSDIKTAIWDLVQGSLAYDPRNEQAQASVSKLRQILGEHSALKNSPEHPRNVFPDLQWSKIADRAIEKTRYSMVRWGPVPYYKTLVDSQGIWIQIRERSLKQTRNSNAER